MSAVDARPRRLRLPTRWVVGLVVVFLAVAGALLVTAGGPARGLDTTCGDFAQMTGAEQTTVIRESGLWAKDPSAGVAYYLEVCPQGDQEDQEDQLKSFEG